MQSTIRKRDEEPTFLVSYHHFLDTPYTSVVGVGHLLQPRSQLYWQRGSLSAVISFGEYSIPEGQLLVERLLLLRLYLPVK